MDLISSEQRNWLKLQLILTKIEEILRNIFKDRWRSQIGSEWTNTKQNISNLITKIGGIKSISKSQRKSIQSGEVSNWDLSTLSRILYKIKDDSINSNILENGQIRQIVDIRNTLAHHPDKNIPGEEFEILWGKLSPISRDLGLSAHEINEIYFHNLSKAEIEKEFFKLKSEGNELFLDSKFLDAIGVYSRAIQLPSLNNEQLGALYSNRCAAYLKLNEEQSNKLALEDANECKRLRPTWFKSHKRIAEAQISLKNYKEALMAFDYAVGLEPNNSELENARNQCRILKVDEEARMDIDPSTNFTIRDFAKRQSQQSGKSIEEEIEILSKSQEFVIKYGGSFGLYAQANQYRDGVQVEKNLEKAAQLYAKAAKMGHIEARYELAQCMIKGRGVNADIPEGIRMLEKLANEEKKARRNCLGKVPEGIVAAQYALGMNYLNGIGVNINPSFAIHWYNKAAINGSGLAANNLGCIYNNDEYVPRDETKTIQYWKMASSASPPVPRAMENLAFLYLAKGNRKEAELYWERAKDNGYTFTRISEDKFQALIKRIKILEHLESNEKNTFFPSKEDIFGLFDKLRDKKVHLPDYFSEINDKCYNEIYQAAQKGSIFAKRLLISIINLKKGLKLYEDLEDSQFISNESWEQIILAMSECARYEEYMSPEISAKFKDGLIDACKKIFAKNVVSELDKAASFCYPLLKTTSYTETISFLETCIKKYPDEARFYELKLSNLGLLREFQKGISEAEIYLKKFPDNWNILYDKSVFAANIENPYKLEFTIQACKDFLNVASVDHRKVPMCYYVIASMYLLKSVDLNSPEFCKAKEYFQKGIDSEKHQFTLFLPYESQSVKEDLQMMLNMLENKPSKSPDNSSFALKKDSTLLNKQLLAPHRASVIKRHRYILKSEVLDFQKPGWQNFLTKGKGAKIQNAPKCLVGLREITLNEMDLTKDRIYEYMLINLQVVERATLMFPSLQMTVEDSNRDVLNCAIYNFDRSKGVDLHFGIGAKMTLLNPYMRMANDGFPMLRVDDPKSIIFLDDDRAKKLCAFCGETGAEKACSMCKANYCSRECQLYDWKVLDHKFVCKKV